MKNTLRVHLKLIQILALALATLLWHVPSLKADPLPDLAITDFKYVRASKDGCRVKYVELSNIGNGAVSPYTAYLQAKIKISTSKGSEEFYMGRLVRSLVNPGDHSRIVPALWLGRVPNGTSTVFRVEIDPEHLIKESNRQNNVLVKTLTCPLLPDLAVIRVYTKPTMQGNCEVWADVKNVGKGEIPQNLFKEGYLTFRFGLDQKIFSKKLEEVDKTGRLRRPNGSIQVKLTDSSKLLKPLQRTRGEVSVTSLASSDGFIVDPNPYNNTKKITLFCPGSRYDERLKPRAKVPSSSKVPSTRPPITPPPIPHKNPLSR